MSNTEEASPIECLTLPKFPTLEKQLATLEKRVNKLTSACNDDKIDDDDLDESTSSLTNAIKEFLSFNYELLVSVEHERRIELKDLISKHMSAVRLKLSTRIKSKRLDELDEQLSTLELLCNANFRLKPLGFTRSRYDCLRKWNHYEDQLVSCIDRINELLGEKNILKSELKVIKNRRQKIVIACLGSLKSTKSSVINFLLQEEICPTADAAATARLTKITYGEKIELILIPKEGQCETVPCESYKELLSKAFKYIVLSKEQRLQGCKDEVIIKIPIEELKGIELWDIPGFDESQVLDTRVREIIHDTDLVFTLIPYRESFRNTFRSFTELLLTDENNDSVDDESNSVRQSQKICFLITQIDTFKINDHTGKSVEDVLSDLFDTLKTELRLKFDTTDMKSCDNFIPICTHHKHKLNAFLECRQTFITKSESWFLKGSQYLQLWRLNYLIRVIQTLFDYGDSERIIQRCMKARTFATEYFQTLISSTSREILKTLSPLSHRMREFIPQLLENPEIKTLLSGQNESQGIDEVIKNKVNEKMLELFQLQGTKIQYIVQNIREKHARQFINIEEAELLEEVAAEVCFNPYKQGIGYFDNAYVFGSEIYTIDTWIVRILESSTPRSLLGYLDPIKPMVGLGLSLVLLLSRAGLSAIGGIAKFLHIGSKSQLEAAINQCIVDFSNALTEHVVEFFTKYYQSMQAKALTKLSEREKEAKSLSVKQREILQSNIATDQLRLGELYLNLLAEKFKLNYSNFLLSTELLGASNFEVFSATIQFSDNTVLNCAAKRIPLNQFNLQEVRYLHRLNHPNLVKCYGIAKLNAEENIFYLIMERLDGDLQKYLEQHSSTLNEKQVLKMFTEITVALLFIHQRDLTHRDIKPQNILCKKSDDEVSFHLADFGLIHRDPVTFCGTRKYIAPEFTNGNLGPITNKADVYSWGITIKEIIDKLPKTISENSINIQSWKSTAYKCINEKPQKRPSCEQLVFDHITDHLVNN